jgi:iron complex outermembrane receptor protein
VVSGFTARRSAAATLLLFGSLLAHAETQESVEAFDEVVVTARKRNENAQDVPISMSIRTGTELAERNTFRIQEIVRTMPNVATEIQHARQASVAIRGLGKNPANDGLEASVGVFVDGVYLGRTGMAVTDLIDVERIEILRGPQGTLFGKNTTAGALNIVTNSPGADFEAWAQMSLGSDDLAQLSGAINAPLVPGRLAFRLSAFDSARNGFVYNETTGQHLGEIDRNGARAQLLWTPAESTRLRFIAEYNSQDEAGPGYHMVDPGIVMADGSIRPNNYLDRSARAGYTPDIVRFSRSTDAEAAQRNTTDQAAFSVQADVNLGGLSLTSISAWRKFNFRPQNDGDYCFLTVQPVFGVSMHHRQFSQELRLSSDAQENFDYLIGAYYFAQELQSSQNILYGVHAADFMTAGLTPLALDGFHVSTNSDPETASLALFAQGTWRPASGWELTGGVRWTDESRSAHIERNSSGGAVLPTTSTAALAARARLGGFVATDVETEEEFVSGLLSARYEFSENMMTYLSASRGAKSGGINVAIVAPGVDQTLRPETANAIELGWKSQWLGQRLQLNLATFWMDIDDYQATLRDRSLNTFYLTNAGSVRSRGVELESRYRPLPGLDLSLAAGWNDAEYTSFTSAPCPVEVVGQTTCDFTGERVVGAPPWSATGAVRYSVPLGAGGKRAFLDAEYTHIAAHNLDLSDYTHVDAYGLGNLQLGLQGPDDRWRAWIWGRNLLDTDYYTTLATAGAFGSGALVGLMGDPRTYGFSVHARF